MVQHKPARSLFGHPFMSQLLIAALDRGPGGAEGALFLPWITRSRCESVIEGLAKNILRMRGQVVSNRERKVFVSGVWHETLVLADESFEGKHCLSARRMFFARSDSLKPALAVTGAGEKVDW